jgi:hypothetical protein
MEHLTPLAQFVVVLVLVILACRVEFFKIHKNGDDFECHYRAKK